MWKLGNWEMWKLGVFYKSPNSIEAFFIFKFSNFQIFQLSYFFSDRYLSASIAALHPDPAAVTA